MTYIIEAKFLWWDKKINPITTNNKIVGLNMQIMTNVSRYSILIGGLGYTAYSAQMLWLSDALLYLCALLNGIGASLLWTGQGNFLTVNTSSATTARDSGVFWSLYQFRQNCI